MAYNIANSELAKRIRKASSDMAVAARRNRPELDHEARRQSGLAHIENQILLHQAYLTEDDRTALAHILFDTSVPASLPAQGPSRTRATVRPYDPDNEVEDEEDE